MTISTAALLLTLGLLVRSSAVQGQTACFAAVFDTLDSGFHYKAHLNMPSSCAANQTRATRLFIAGACGIEHNNNFDGNPPHCPNGDANILNTSQATCELVFNHAWPHDLAYPQGNETFDSGSICNNGIKSVIFVKTNCTQLTATSVVLQQRAVSDEFCWDGKTLSHGALAGIVIGSIIGFCLLVCVPCGLYAWYRQRRIRLHQSKRGGHDELATSSSWLFSRQVGYPVGTLPPQSLYGDDDTYNVAYDVELQHETSGSPLVSTESSSVTPRES